MTTLGFGDFIVITRGGSIVTVIATIAGMLINVLFTVSVLQQISLTHYQQVSCHPGVDGVDERTPAAPRWPENARVNHKISISERESSELTTIIHAVTRFLPVLADGDEFSRPPVGRA